MILLRVFLGWLLRLFVLCFIVVMGIVCFCGCVFNSVVFLFFFMWFDAQFDVYIHVCMCCKAAIVVSIDCRFVAVVCSL